MLNSIGAGNMLTSTLTGLVSGTVYAIRVAAISDIGRGGISEPVIA